MQYIIYPYRLNFEVKFELIKERVGELIITTLHEVNPLT